MPSAPAESRDDYQDPVEVDERHAAGSSINFVSPDSFPPEDVQMQGNFPLTYRAGEWYI